MVIIELAPGYSKFWRIP